MFSFCCIWSMASVASLSDMFGARLNDTVTDGNSPVWLSDSGVVLACALATLNSGVFPLTVEFLADGCRYTLFSPSGVAQYSGATSSTT